MGLFAKTLTAIAFAGVASIANANLITNGDFESNVGLSNGAWGVYGSIDGWNTLSGPGIEIQKNTIVTAQSGSQYVELDSYSNSSMYQAITGLTIGQSYDLDFWYHTRTNNGGNDNGINVYWGASAPGDLQLAISDLVSSQTYEWVEYSTNLVASAETMFLTFSAVGLNNSLGGFIDSVTLNEVPEPSNIVLLTIGLLGLMISRRRISQL